MKSYIKVKRVIDFIFALILLILFSPIMILVALGIKIESKEPIIFRHKRPGKNGEVFIVYKFRTMTVKEEKEGRVLSDMERITKFGSFLRKTSLDELPQFINIIKGEMSFIGPRPLLVQYLKYYSEEQMRRHEVLPGISGWAQVNGRNAISWEEKFKLDVWYVDNISFTLDFKILIKTIINILKAKDINSSDEDTMSFFEGTKGVEDSNSTI